MNHTPHLQSQRVDRPLESVPKATNDQQATGAGAYIAVIAVYVHIVVVRSVAPRTDDLPPAVWDTGSRLVERFETHAIETRGGEESPVVASEYVEVVVESSISAVLNRPEIGATSNPESVA